MKTIKGPGIFLAQFVGDKPPFDTLENLASWAADLGYVGLQIPPAWADCSTSHWAPKARLIATM